MTHSRYIIMSNGKGSRWGGHLGIPKQLIEIGGETLLARIARQVRELDPEAEVIVSSSDPRHDTPGVRRHTPARNEIELDRFVPELLVDGSCFLYGDTFYSDEAMAEIVHSGHEALNFFGDERSIVGVSCRRAEVMMKHLERVRAAYLAGDLESCIGWQVYQAYIGKLFEPLHIGAEYHHLTGKTSGFNSPEDLRDFIDRIGQKLECAHA
ncbi:NTP transferase domain-containing protein [Glutamicibacter soli]|uniref:NTP transferase domain-containing protein n=1 Tax=Glutamicibacter soli TaxID=453836 RepID=A0A6L9G758_9MICC|nr:NTP transferase domain-containing protein [Glutamicibacter soli]NAZ16813.1 NTP transferase domain-containing protein [Glutamicibacter soli]